MDVYENILANAYEPNPGYPIKSDRERELAVILNKPVKSLTADEMRNIVDLRHEYDELVVARTEAGQRYNAEVNRLHKQFKADLALQFFGAAGHPKSDRLFGLAWEHGHSGGLGDVYHYYSSFSDLLS